MIDFVFSVVLTSALTTAACSQKHAPAVDPADRVPISKLTERLKQFPGDVDALIARGLAYQRAGEFEKGQSDLEAATRLAPNRSDAWQAYGHGYFVRNNDKDAIAAFDKAIALGPKEPVVFVERGMAYESLGDRQKAIASITSAIEMKKKYGDAYFMRAELWKAAGDWGNAFADYGRAIDVEPNKLAFRLGRAIAHFDRREHENGVEDVKAAIRLNPGDVGVNYKPFRDLKMSPEALAHGEEQVRKMLKDRPAMAEHVKQRDKIWTWAVRKFAGEDLGTLIDWNSDSPEPFLGRSGPADANRRAYIQVAKSRDDLPEHPLRSFDELWSTAVFELHNVASSAEWNNFGKRLEQEKVKRDEFILAMLNSEELAAERTRAFYVMYFFPWLQSKKLNDTDPTRWNATTFNTAGDRRSDLAVWGDDLRIPYYGARFDLACAYREYQRGNYAKVKALVRPLLVNNRALSNQDLSEGYCWLGYANLGLGDIDGAIEDFTTALGFVPDDGPTFLARGIARSKGSQFDEALADFNTALRLDSDLAGAYYSRGYDYLRRGDYDAAARDARAAIKRDPKKPEVYCLRGEIWLRKRDFTHAIADYGKAIQLSPENPTGYRGRAYVFYQQGDLKKSIADWDVVIRLRPKDDEAYASRGTIHLAEERYRQALTDLTRSIELNPDNAIARGSRAEVLLNSHDKSVRNPAQAVLDAKRACELEEWKRAYPITVLASAYAAREDWKNAIKLQTKALSLADEAHRDGYSKTLDVYKAAETKKDRRADHRNAL